MVESISGGGFLSAENPATVPPPLSISEGTASDLINHAEGTCESREPIELVVQWCRMSRSLEQRQDSIVDRLMNETHFLLQNNKLSSLQAIRVLVQCGWTDLQPPDLVDALCKFILRNYQNPDLRKGKKSDAFLQAKEVVELLSALSRLKYKAHRNEKYVYEESSWASRLYSSLVEDIRKRKWEQEKKRSLLPLLCSMCEWGDEVVLKHQLFFDRLLHLVTSSLNFYNGKQLSRVIHCMGLLGARAESVVHIMVDELKQPDMLRRLDPTGLSILVESLGKIGCLPTLEFEKVIQRFFSPVLLSKMSVRNLCSLLRGLSYYDQDGMRWMMAVLREAAIPPRLNSMNPQDISGLLFACGRSNLCSEAHIIIDRIVLSLMRMRIMEFPNNCLVNIMHGLALSKHTMRDTWIKLYAEVQELWRIEAYTPREVAILCWAMASTGNYDASLFEKLICLYAQTPQLQSRVDEMRIGISQVLYSCAQYRHRNTSLFHEIWMGMKSMDRPDLCSFAQLIWTLSVVGCLRKDQYSHFTKVVARSVVDSELAGPQLDRYKSEIDLHIISRRSASGSDIQQFVSEARFGHKIEETPSKFVADIQNCLETLKTGGWLVHVQYMLQGFVFPIDRCALLIPLKSADYGFDLVENCLKLRGPYAAKLENLEKIGYKVVCINQHQWDAATEEERLAIVCQCMSDLSIPTS